MSNKTDKTEKSSQTQLLVVLLQQRAAVNDGLIEIWKDRDITKAFFCGGRAEAFREAADLVEEHGC